MSSRPLISVVCNFLNEEKFIQEAIESVFAQTYTNWELLLVDDGSTDGSTQIARRYAEEYPTKAYYLEHPDHRNQGASASRNLGIGQARGECIAFLDADDIWLPHKLQQQVAILSSQPKATVLYGNTLYWYSWTGNPEDVHLDYVPELVSKHNTLFEPPRLLTLTYPLGKGTSPHTSNLLLRREATERTGGFEESFKRVYTDQAFLVKLYLKEHVLVAGESECWNRYRLHSRSSTAVIRAAGQHFLERQIFLNWLEEYLSQQGLEGKEAWKLLKEQQHVVQVRVSVGKQEWRQAIRSTLILLRYHPRILVRVLQKARLITRVRRLLGLA